jgi:hypothetical protein
MPPTWKAAIRDYEFLIRKTETIAADVRNRLQIMQNRSAIYEARQGLLQADSVRR